jgi:hypothetical protein
MRNPGGGSRGRRQVGWLGRFRGQRRQRLLQWLSRQPRNPLRARARERTSYYGATEEPEVGPRGSYYDITQLQAQTARVTREEKAETARVTPEERAGTPRTRQQGKREAESRRKQQTKDTKGKTRR